MYTVSILISDSRCINRRKPSLKLRTVARSRNLILWPVQRSVKQSILARRECYSSGQKINLAETTRNRAPLFTSQLLFHFATGGSGPWCDREGRDLYHSLGERGWYFLALLFVKDEFVGFNLSGKMKEWAFGFNRSFPRGKIRGVHNFKGRFKGTSERVACATGCSCHTTLFRHKW